MPAALCIACLSQANSPLARGSRLHPQWGLGLSSIPTLCPILARFCPALDSWLSLSAENLCSLRNIVKVGVGSHRPTSRPLVSRFPPPSPHCSEDHQGRTLCLCFQSQLCLSASACLLWEQTNLGETAQNHRLKDIPFQSVATHYFRHRIQETFRYTNQNGHMHWV